MKDPYARLLARKRSWTPVKTTAGQLVPGGEEVIRRALALRHMELPVGQFITDSLSEIPKAATDLLLSNARDEERHDSALGFLAEAIGADPLFEREALALREAWTSHPDHTVLKALVAERAVFFVLLPIFRFLGDGGSRTTSADISRDEQVHVAANTLVCAELGLTPSPSLDKLRKATIAWVTEPLSRNENRYLDRDFWRNVSDDLMYQGKAPELAQTRRARMPAFFEHSNNDLPSYA
jgi:hypothetical protein